MRWDIDIAHHCKPRRLNACSVSLIQKMRLIDDKQEVLSENDDQPYQHHDNQNNLHRTHPVLFPQKFSHSFYLTHFSSLSAADAAIDLLPVTYLKRQGP